MFYVLKRVPQLIKQLSHLSYLQITACQERIDERFKREHPNSRRNQRSFIPGKKDRTNKGLPQINIAILSLSQADFSLFSGSSTLPLVRSLFLQKQRNCGTKWRANEMRVADTTNGPVNVLQFRLTATQFILLPARYKANRR